MVCKCGSKIGALSWPGGSKLYVAGKYMAEPSGSEVVRTALLQAYGHAKVLDVVFGRAATITNAYQ